MIQDNETIEQVATFERKPNFKCKFKINKYTEPEKELFQMFDFQHSLLTQNEVEKVVTIILDTDKSTQRQNLTLEKQK